MKARKSSGWDDGFGADLCKRGIEELQEIVACLRTAVLERDGKMPRFREPLEKEVIRLRREAARMMRKGKLAEDQIGLRIALPDGNGSVFSRGL